MFRFNLPFGETVVGFLLEDLTSFTKPLPRWFNDYHRRFLHLKGGSVGGDVSDDSSMDSSDEEDFDWEDEEENLDFRQLRPFVRPFLVLSSSSPSSFTDCVSCFQLDRVFAALRQLHDSGRARFFSLECSDLLVIGDEPSQVEIVITGLSPSQIRADYETEMREDELKQIKKYGLEEGRQDWYCLLEPEKTRLGLTLERVVPFHIMLAFNEARYAERRQL
jgi:hypothetical protein